MELLVKDILPDLDKATDVSKRISEVRAKPITKASQYPDMSPDQFDALQYAMQVQMERQQYEAMQRQVKQNQLAAMQQAPQGIFGLGRLGY